MLALFELTRMRPLYRSSTGNGKFFSLLHRSSGLVPVKMLSLLMTVRVTGRFTNSLKAKPFSRMHWEFESLDLLTTFVAYNLFIFAF